MSKKNFRPTHPTSTREAALEMLREAAKQGKTQAEAARYVAAEFTDGPPLTTLLTWARRDGITFAKKTAKKTAARAAEGTISRNDASQHREKGAVKKPTYSREFRTAAASNVVALMDQEGLSLHAAALRLQEQEPGMPSTGTLRNWVNAHVDATPLQTTAVVETAAAPVPEAADVDPESLIDEGVDDLASVEEAANAVQPDTLVVRTQQDLFETQDFLVRYELLVKENQKLRDDNARLAEAAESAAKLRKEVATLRATVRNYFEILAHDDQN
ncbi:hypothetical protein [Nocardia africana]